MGKSSIAVVLCLFVACNLFVDEVTSECCLADLIDGDCGDGTKGTPYCGYGSCNIFGCNCDGGCRHRAGRSLKLPEAVDGFAKIDANGDGKVSLEEAKTHINSNGGAWKPETDFARMDANSDGFLSKDEIDSVAKA